jgi:1,4-dihydroxy-6-naphthoate synthase
VTRDITIAYTPDSDDAFYYFALETRRVLMPGFTADFVRAPLSTLNPAAIAGTYDVTAISSVLYPQIADRYAILSVGTSVGRGYGPVLVSRHFRQLGELRGRLVGVGGIPTTGWFLLRWLCPEALPVAMPFDRIGAAVAAGEIDAGVMIHEDLLYFPRLGLYRVADLGAEWCRRHELPLPVGLNVIRRELGRAAMERICAAIRRSLRYGLRNQRAALTWAEGFGRGAVRAVTTEFVEMFANEDSVRLPADARRALRVLLKEAAELGLTPAMAELDVIEGTARRASRSIR